MARDGRVVLLADGGPEALVAAVLGGVERRLSARRARGSPTATTRSAGIVEFLPPGARAAARRRGRAPTSPLDADPRRRRRPGPGPGAGPLRRPGAVRQRPFSAAEAARTVTDTAVETLRARGEPARYERLLGEILVGLDRAGQLAGCGSARDARPRRRREPATEHGRPSRRSRSGRRRSTRTPTTPRRAGRAVARPARHDSPARRRRTARRRVVGPGRPAARARSATSWPPTQRRLVEIEPGRWWLGDPQDVASRGASPLADRVEWAVFSLLSTAGPLVRGGVLRADRVAVHRPRPARRGAWSGRASRATGARPARRTASSPTDDLLAPQPGAHRAARAPRRRPATGSGMRVWIGRREQSAPARRGTARRPARPARATTPTSAAISRAAEELAEVDCIWYLRGKVALLFEVEWTAMLGEPLLRRHARIPPDDASSASSSSPPSAPSSSATSSLARRCCGPRSRQRQLAHHQVRPPAPFLAPRRRRPRRPRAATSDSIRHRAERRADAPLRRLSDRRRPTASRHATTGPVRPSGTLTPRRLRGQIPAVEPPAPRRRQETDRDLDDQPDRRSNELADRFWEAILELNPTTATFYGDERYADRLEDPGPEGRARRARSWSGPPTRRAAISTDGLPTEDRITRDMLLVIAELNIEEDDQRLYQLRVVDQMGGPQQLLPAADPVPAGRYARAPRGLPRPAHAYPAFMAANSRSSSTASHSGLTAPRIVAERTIAQIERMLAVPIDAGDRPLDGQGRVRRRPRTGPRGRPRRGLPGRHGLPRHAARRLSRREPGGAGHLVRARTATSSTGPRSGAGRRSTSTRSDVHQIGLDELEPIEAERREIAASGRLRRRHRRLPGCPRRRPGQHPETKDELVARADRGHRARDGRRAALLRRPAQGRRARSARSRSTRRRTRRSPTTTRPRPTARAPGIYYANGYDLPSRKYTKLATTTYHEAAPGPPLPDHPRDGEPAPQHVPAARGAGGRRRLRRGLGPLQRAAGRRDGPVPQRGERFGMLDAQAWRAARLVVDTGLHALRWPRQRSIDFLREAGLSETDAVIETDRYIAWPGQALTYKIGQREIERLRAELSAATAQRSTCARSTTRCSATARCRWRRWRASSRTGSRPPSDPRAPNDQVKRKHLPRNVVRRGTTAARFEVGLVCDGAERRRTITILTAPQGTGGMCPCPVGPDGPCARTSWS